MKGELMNKISRRVNKVIGFEPDMLDDIESYMEANDLNFPDSVRRLIAANFIKEEISIDDSIPSSDSVVPSEQPPDTNQDSDITPNNKNKDFNWNDVNIG